MEIYFSLRRRKYNYPMRNHTQLWIKWISLVKRWWHSPRLRVSKVIKRCRKKLQSCLAKDIQIKMDLLLQVMNLRDGEDFRYRKGKNNWDVRKKNKKSWKGRPNLNDLGRLSMKSTWLSTQHRGTRSCLIVLRSMLWGLQRNEREWMMRLRRWRSTQMTSLTFIRIIRKPFHVLLLRKR